MTNRPVIFAAILVSIAGSLPFGAGLDSYTDVGCTRLYAADENAAKAAPAGEQYNKRVDALIAILNAAKPNAAGSERQVVVEAIAELGRLCAERAVPALVSKLAFHVSEHGVVDDIRPPAMEKMYPAIRALTEIGEHALPFISDAVAAAEKNEYFDEIARLTILRIKGNLKKGNEYLRERVKLYDAGRERLKAIISEP